MLLKANLLSKCYKTGAIGQRVVVCPVNNVSIEISVGQTLAIAGESGSGKTSLARLIGGLEKFDTGQLFFNDTDLSKANRRQKKQFRRQVQYIFQELYETLNPKRTVKQTLIEPLKIHYPKLNTAEKNVRVGIKLEEVGLSELLSNKYPHELSGGQRQRVAIARALMLEPSLIIADEPVSALDVSIRSQILNLLLSIQKQEHITYIVISHDLSILRHLCNQIIIYYAGTIVEQYTDINYLFKNEGAHPYTRKLIAAAYFNVKEKLETEQLAKNILAPDIIGCRYYHSCPRRSEICSRQAPQLRMHSKGLVACHHPY